jgi:hypothetical protein
MTTTPNTPKTGIYNRWRTLLQFLVALGAPLESNLRVHPNLIAFLSVIAGIPATILGITITIFGTQITVLSLLGYFLFLLSLLPTVYVVLRWLEMSLKDHIGGLRLKDMEKLKTSLLPYSIQFPQPSDLDRIVELADQIYGGTMAAGLGPNKEDRIAFRQLYYRSLFAANPDTFLMIMKNKDLVGYMSIFPMNSIATSRFLRGVLSYTEFDASELQLDSLQKVTGSFCMEATVALPREIREHERNDKDLVGQALVRQLRYLIDKHGVVNVHLIAPGYGYMGKRSLVRKGFVHSGAKCKNGYDVLELQEPGKLGQNGRAFLTAIRTIDVAEIPVL